MRSKNRKITTRSSSTSDRRRGASNRTTYKKTNNESLEPAVPQKRGNQHKRKNHTTRSTAGSAKTIKTGNKKYSDNTPPRSRDNDEDYSGTSSNLLNNSQRVDTWEEKQQGSSVLTVIESVNYTEPIENAQEDIEPGSKDFLKTVSRLETQVSTQKILFLVRIFYFLWKKSNIYLFFSTKSC